MKMHHDPAAQATSDAEGTDRGRPDAAGRRVDSDGDESSAANDVGGDLRKMWDALCGLAEVRALQVRRALRDAMLRLCAGLWLAAVLLCATAVAVGLTLFGIAGALAEAFDGRWWAGALTTGVAVLVAVPLVAVVLRSRDAKRRLRKLRRPATRSTGAPEAGEETRHG